MVQYKLNKEIVIDCYNVCTIMQPFSRATTEPGKEIQVLMQPDSSLHTEKILKYNKEGFCIGSGIGEITNKQVCHIFDVEAEAEYAYLDVEFSGECKKIWLNGRLIQILDLQGTNRLILKLQKGINRFLIETRRVQPEDRF